MPVYEYRCEDCGALTEVLVRSHQTEPPNCDVCGSSTLTKVLSVTNVRSQLPQRAPGRTCCGREQRCSQPPCHDGSSCCSH